MENTIQSPINNQVLANFLNNKNIKPVENVNKEVKVVEIVNQNFNPYGNQNFNPYIYILEKEFSALKDVNIISLDLLTNDKPVQDVSPVMEGTNLFKISNFHSVPPKKENNLYGEPVMIGPFSAFYLDSVNSSIETTFNVQFKTSDKPSLQTNQQLKNIATSLKNFAKSRQSLIYLNDIEITQKTEINVENINMNLAIPQIIILENIKGKVPIVVSSTNPLTIVSINSNINVVVTHKNNRLFENKIKLNKIEYFTNTDSLTNINLISIFLIFILGSVILYLINVKNCRLIN